MQRPIKSKIEPISFTAGVTKTRQIPTTVYRKLSLNFVLNCTFSSVTTFGIDQLMSFVKNIDLTVNGNKTIYKGPLNYLYLRNFIENMGVLSYDVTKTDGTRNVYLQLDLPFTVPGGYKEEDTLLDLRNATTAVLKVDFGSPTISGLTVNSGSIAINTDEYVFTDANAQDIYQNFEVDYTAFSITKTGKQPLDLPRGFDLNYYRIIMEVFNSSNARANDQLNEISIVAGNTTFSLEEATRIQQEQAVNYTIPPASWPTGIYVIDFTRGGRLTQLLGTQDLSQFDANFDAAASGGTVNVYLERIARPMDVQLGVVKKIQAATPAA